LKGDPITVGSAGTWGRNGNQATPEVSAASELGVDIRTHRASRFDAHLANHADLLITMTAEQVEEVLEQAPEARAKTFTLKELVSILGSLPPLTAGTPTREALLERVAEADRARSDGHPMPIDLDVADPLGLSTDVYRAVAKELEGLVDDLVHLLITGRSVSPLRHE
jgi:protein-tyrosine phosphatase